MIPKDVALQYGLSGANLRASGVDCDLRRDQRAADGVGQGRLEGLDPPRRRQLRPLLGAPAGDARVDARSSTSCSTRCRPGRSWPRCRASSRCPRARRGSATENPLGEMGYYVVSKGDLGPFRVKIRSASFNNIASCRGCCAACTCPTSSRSSPRCTSSSGTSIDDDRSDRRSPYWGAVAAARARRHRRRAAAGRHDRLPVPVQDDELHAEPPRADGSRAVRLDAAVRRSRQVAAEGRHPPGAGRPADLQDGPADRARQHVPARRRRAVRPRRVLHQLRRRRVLHARRQLGQRARHPHRRLVERQQVLAARRPARGRPADRLRAADGARRDRRRHPGRHDEPAGHRRRSRTRARSSAGTASATRTSSPSSSASASS